MRTCLMAMLMLTLNGCVTAPASDPICARTERPRTALAAALVADGGPQSKARGRDVIAILDAGCAK